jgi:hypothetical protein
MISLAYYGGVFARGKGMQLANNAAWCCCVIKISAGPDCRISFAQARKERKKVERLS